MSVLAAVLGGFAVAFFDRIPPWAFQLLVASGTVLVTLMIDYSGAQTSPYAFFYIWLALYALFFFSAAQAVMHVLFIAIAYAAVVVDDVTSGGQAALVAIGEAAPRWIMTVGTLVVAVALLGMLKDRLDGLVERFADAARQDPVTGLRNRRGFDETFELEVERARRAGRTLTLLVGDLDHFKTVNDRLGHPRGDDALRRAGEILRATNRRIDMVARVGGEEFAVLLPDSDERGAHIAAERMRHAIRRLRRRSRAAHDQLRDRELSRTRGDHRGPDGERRPGALHGEGDRPRLLGDLSRRTRPRVSRATHAAAARAARRAC